jgi:hypothetical protein
MTASALHPLGFVLAPATRRHVWHLRVGEQRTLRQAGADSADGPAVDPTWPACVHHGTPDCAPCGACCREAFDSVPLGPEDDATAERHPHLVRTSTGWRDLERVPSPSGCGTPLRRPGGRRSAAAYRCTIYAGPAHRLPRPRARVAQLRVRAASRGAVAAGPGRCGSGRRRLTWVGRGEERGETGVGARACRCTVARDRPAARQSSPRASPASRVSARSRTNARPRTPARSSTGASSRAGSSRSSRTSSSRPIPTSSSSATRSRTPT